MDITITKTFTYTDSEENIRFWAASRGWTPYVMGGIDGQTPDPSQPIDLKGWCEAYITRLIAQALTDPIRAAVAAELSAQAAAQAAQAAEAKAAEVLSRLTVE